jgi:diadenosine tetraphosphate (Ap4A) HIT family hydrolase
MVLQMSNSCRFCDLVSSKSKAVEYYNSVCLLLDTSPVTSGHVLIIPAEHRADYFELTQDELLDTDSALREQRSRMSAADTSITGFNIGWNCGTSAGQTVFHAHCHLIPRRQGDTTRPEGGVRGVIPGEQHY